MCREEEVNSDSTVGALRLAHTNRLRSVPLLTAGKAAAQIISATGVAVSVPAPGIETEEGEKDRVNEMN